MIRVLLAALLLMLVVLVATQVVRSARKSNVDWAGIGFIGAFVFLAFWLRDLTGLG